MKNCSWKNNCGRRKPNQGKPGHCIRDPPAGRALTGRGQRRGAGGRPGAGRCPLGGLAGGSAVRRSSPEQLGGALVRAGISSCNDNTARDRSGDPTAHRAEPGQRCQARPPGAGGSPAPPGTGAPSQLPETGPHRSAGQWHRHSLPGDGGSRGAAAAILSRESPASGGCAQERPAGMGPVPPRPRRRSPPPARQEHRAAAAPPRTRARSAGRAERRCLSCRCCDPPPAAAPPPPGGSMAVLVGDKLVMSRQVWPCGQEGQWYPGVHREECGQQVVFPLYSALVRPHLEC